MTGEAKGIEIGQRIGMSPFATKLGVSCELVEPDRAVFAMPFNEENTTVGDLVHGGATASLVDIAATAAAWSAIEDPEKHRGTTVDLSLSFVAAARSQELRADARVLRRGSTISFCSVEVTGDDGALVAQAKVVYKLTRLPSPAESVAKLFAGKATQEQMALLAELERGGATRYRELAEREPDADRKAALLEAAEREEANARVLEAGSK